MHLFPNLFKKEFKAVIRLNLLEFLYLFEIDTIIITTHRLSWGLNKMREREYVAAEVLKYCALFPA